MYALKETWVCKEFARIPSYSMLFDGVLESVEDGAMVVSSLRQKTERERERGRSNLDYQLWTTE